MGKDGDGKDGRMEGWKDCDIHQLSRHKNDRGPRVSDLKMVGVRIFSKNGGCPDLFPH